MKKRRRKRKGPSKEQLSKYDPALAVILKALDKKPVVPKGFVAEVGRRVEILDHSIVCLKHRRKPWFGRITHIEGGYYYIKPSWCKFEIELYHNEFKVIT